MDYSTKMSKAKRERGIQIEEKAAPKRLEDPIEVLKADRERHLAVGNGKSPVADAIDWTLEELVKLQSVASTEELRGDLARAVEEISRLRISKDRDLYCPMCASKDQVVKNLKAEVEKLKAALQDLLEEQEGPPLIRREKEWQRAVDEARAAMSEPEVE